MLRKCQTPIWIRQLTHLRFKVLMLHNLLYWMF